MITRLFILSYTSYTQKCLWGPIPRTLTLPLRVENIDYTKLVTNKLNLRALRDVLGILARWSLELM